MSMTAADQTGRHPVIELGGVTKIYGTGVAAMHALRGIDLRIDESEHQ